MEEIFSLGPRNLLFIVSVAKYWRADIDPVYVPCRGFPGCSVVNNSPATGNTDWIPGLGRSPREENGIPLQYSSSFLGNAMDRGAWWATIHGVTKESDMTEWLNNTIYHAEHKQSLFQEHPMAI